MIENFKTKLIKLKLVLSENKYFQRIFAKTPQYNTSLLQEGIINLYIKELLQKLENDIITDYEQQLKVQKLYSNDIVYTHSKEHRDIMRNLEILLNNLAKVKKALDEIAIAETDVITQHIKKVLDIQSTTVILSKKKRK